VWLQVLAKPGSGHRSAKTSIDVDGRNWSHLIVDYRRVSLYVPTYVCMYILLYIFSVVFLLSFVYFCFRSILLTSPSRFFRLSFCVLLLFCNSSTFCSHCFFTSSR
jgi:hypothetical protein